MNLRRIILFVVALIIASNLCLAQSDDETDQEVDDPVAAPVDSGEATTGFSNLPLLPGVPERHYSSTVIGGRGGPPLEDTMQRHVDQALSATDPVAGSGELVLQRTDLSFPGFGIPFEFRRTYRSRVRYQGALGFGWAHNYDRRIVPLCQAGVTNCSGDVSYESGSLEKITFRPTATNTAGSIVDYLPDPGVPLQLFRVTGPVEHRWLLIDGTGIDAYFDGDDGTLTELKDRAGNRLQITWLRDSNLPEGGIIDHVTDTTGRVIYYVHKILSRPDGLSAVTLECISLEPTCKDPLLAFEQSSSGQQGEEFDLVAVRDAMGRAQSFNYYRQAPSPDISIDDFSLSGACHRLCDARTDDQSTWENADLCEAAVQDVLKFRCDFADSNAAPILFQPEPLLCSEPHVPCHPHSLQTTDGKLLPWLDQAPMVLDLAHGQTYWDARYPGFRYCTETCVVSPLDPSVCTSDVFPDCHKLSSVISGPEGDVLQSPDYLYYREACHCILATNQTYCSFHPQAPGCSNVLTEDAAIGISGNMMGGYAAKCRAYFDPVLHSANIGCPDRCNHECVINHAARDKNGFRRYAFGAANDIDHNLTDIFDGDGRLVLHNEYGLDRFNVSYDRVIRQRLGDGPSENELTISYHNLTLEQQSIDGTLPVLEATTAADFAAAGLPTNGGSGVQELMARRQHAIDPDPARVTPISRFDAVDVCPKVCTREIPIAAIFSTLKGPVFPIEVLNDTEQQALRETNPLTLHAVNDAEVEVRRFYSSDAEARHTQRELANVGTRWGNVSFRISPRGGTIDIKGSLRAIDLLFGSGDELEMMPGSGKRRLIRPVAPRSAPQDASRGAAGLSTRYLPSINSTSQGSEYVYGGRPKILDKLAELPPTNSTASDPLGNELARAGLPDGGARLVIRRTGPRSATLPPASESGAQLAVIVVGGARVVLKATNVPLRWSVEGGAARLLGTNEAVILLKSDPGTWAVQSLPRSNSWVADARRSERSTAATWGRYKQHAPQFCAAWNVGDSVPHNGPVDDIDTPKYAVVVTDPHGTARTQYFDSQWRIIREVNLASHEQFDRNYFGNGGSCTRFPAGDRLVLNSDFFGRATELVELPAKGYLGDAVAQTTDLSYTSSGPLTREVKAVGTPDTSSVNLRRDGAGRLRRVEMGVGDKPILTFDLQYVTPPGVDPHDVSPSVIRSPSGIETEFVQFDPSGGGPRVMVAGANTAHPLTSQFTYDAFGRVIGTVRSKHLDTRSRETYDRAGLLTRIEQADHVDYVKKLDSTITHNASGQVLRVQDANVRTCYKFNSLDQLVWIKETAVSDSSVQRSACMHHGVDGRIEYAILPEGNVVVWHYQSDGRLASLEQGKPANLQDWTHACITDSPAPLDVKSIGTPRRPQVQNPHRFPNNLAERSPAATKPGPLATGKLNRPVITVPVEPCLLVTPDWPLDSLMQQTDFQTIVAAEYQPGGFFKSITDGAGVKTLFETDGFGRVIVARNALGSALWQGFDAADRLGWRAFVGPKAQPYHRPMILESDLPLLSMAEYQYDFAGRLRLDRQWHFSALTPPGSTPTTSTTRYLYDDKTRSLTINVDGQSVLTLSNDEIKATSSLLVGGVPWMIERWKDAGAAGDRVDAAVLNQGVQRVERRVINDFGQTASVTDVNGVETWKNAFDRFGRLSSSKGPQGGVATFTYDPFGRVESWMMSGEKISDFTYLHDDTLAGISYGNASGGPFKSTFSYDGLNRLIAIHEPQGLTTTLSYEPGTSRLKTKTDPAGTTFLFAYDPAAGLRQVAAQPASGMPSNMAVQDFSFDILGRLQFAQNTLTPGTPTNGLRIVFDYDSTGCIVGEKSSGFLPFVVQRQCDARGNSINTTFISKSGTKLSLDRQFDPFGRVTNLEANNQHVASIDYSGFGRPTRISYGNGALTASESTANTGLSTTLSLTASNGTELSRFIERRGKDATAIVREQTVGTWSSSDAFGSDDHGRLIVEAHDVGVGAPVLSTSTPSRADVDASLSFSPDWNRTTLDSLSNWAQSTRTTGATLYSVDALNAYTTIAGTPLSYDANHNLLNYSAYAATYDIFGHLATRTANGATVQFAYDPLGRRVSELDMNSGETRSMVWDGASVVGHGSSSDLSTFTMLASGERDNAIAVLDKFGKGAMHFLATRADDSTVAMINNGLVEETYNYSGYGETKVRLLGGLTSGTSTHHNRWLFQGQWQDSASGDYMFRAREYSPPLGRFLSRDPLGLTGGTNQYGFASGKPLELGDSNGTFPTAPGGGISNARLAMLLKNNNLTARELDAIRKVLTPTQIASIQKSLEVFKRRDTVGEVLKRVNTDATETLIKAGYGTMAASIVAPMIPLGLLESPGVYIGAKAAVHAPWVMPLTYHLAAGVIGAPTVGGVVSRTLGAGMGPASASEIAPLAEQSIGPSFRTLEEAAASGGHQAQVVLRRYGQTIATWWENSHLGSNFGGHTEQKAMARVMELIGREGAEGLELEINGYHPPCPYGGGCMNTMQWFANQYDIIVDYGAKGARYIFQSEYP